MRSWIANLKSKLGRHLVVPILAIAMVGSFVAYDFVKAMPAKAAMAGSHDRTSMTTAWARCSRSTRPWRRWRRASPPRS